MGFNSAFKGLNNLRSTPISNPLYVNISGVVIAYTLCYSLNQEFPTFSGARTRSFSKLCCRTFFKIYLSN
jgi:hypothetical protein